KCDPPRRLDVLAIGINRGQLVLDRELFAGRNRAPRHFALKRRPRYCHSRKAARALTRDILPDNTARSRYRRHVHRRGAGNRRAAVYGEDSDHAARPGRGRACRAALGHGGGGGPAPRGGRGSSPARPPPPPAPPTARGPEPPSPPPTGSPP